MENVNEKQKTMGEPSETQVTLKTFCSMLMADIDIFLLQEEDQKTDKDKLYTKEEIREQLHKSLKKCLTIKPLEMLIDIPLFEALSREALRKAGFSERQISEYEKMVDAS